MSQYLIFDIGGTAVKYACSDESGHMMDNGSFPTPADSFESMRNKMRHVYEEICSTRELVGIAISSPGAVDCEGGVVRGISAIDYIHGFPIAEEISRSMHGLPVSIENDANCATLGELWKGAAAGKKNIASVVCGTGIGGSVVIDGKIHHGSTNNGGELGNCIINYEAGVYRTWSSCTMVKQARKYQQETGRAVDGKGMLELADSGDLVAARLTDEFYQAMAIGFYNVQFTLDLELIVFGGGVSESPVVITGIRSRMEQMAKKERFGFLMPKIVPCRYGNQANLYGALYHHLNSRNIIGGQHGI